MLRSQLLQHEVYTQPDPRSAITVALEVLTFQGFRAFALEFGVDLKPIGATTNEVPLSPTASISTVRLVSSSKATHLHTLDFRSGLYHHHHRPSISLGHSPVLERVKSTVSAFWSRSSSGSVTAFVLVAFDTYPKQSSQRRFGCHIYFTASI
ncbi:hypothetical protein G7K_6531-t1 [Saitoella complicata NRRL Y-17804]|uniref:Uncharacterized protein n=1 Tax=Saitoella complicata (strain BCRC 22490 / CBS 7301 / JCM 7358 / NBRC 10748 / NRRL Y-17804) TaxID=698492 RepID=A0A0E9NSP2_SAICN|nr:hypothetical protein G7K_6531-t1 [Saitoella complicata NRRL Y-17804]